MLKQQGCTSFFAFMNMGWTIFYLMPIDTSYVGLFGVKVHAIGVQGYDF
jgi:hypothetical protein